MIRTIILAGGEGPDRSKYIKQYIDSNLTKGDIIIYDYTYSLITYNKHENVAYYCVDTCLAYLNKLNELLKEKVSKNTKEIYIVSDAYGGLFFQANVRSIFDELLKYKEDYKINILLSTRHLDYIPKEYIDSFDKVIDYKDINGKLSNDYFKNLNK